MGVVTLRPRDLYIDGLWYNIGGASIASVLSDNNWNTFISLQNFGTIRAYYPPLLAAQIPVGRVIIAPRLWCTYNIIAYPFFQLRAPESYLDANGQRVLSSKILAFDPSAYGQEVTQYSDIQVRSDYTPWSLADINTLTSEHINRYQEYIDIPEVGIDVIYSEPLSATAPAVTYPANAGTIATSSVNFSATFPAPQDSQGVRGVFQVASNAGFTANVKTFYGGFQFGTAGGSQVAYTSVWNGPSNTDLGPGVWYLRIKAQDVVSQVTAWSASTTFTISHAALVAPAIIDPSSGTTVTTPYSIRRANPTTVASDNRAMAMEWQFSKDSTFATGVVDWVYAAGSVTTDPLSYNPTPVVGLAAGLYGNTVSSLDPSQYLAQGLWYERVRIRDKWTQFSPWSASLLFTVSHPPLAISTVPTSNGVIDQAKSPLAWTFSDTYAADIQSAYQVLVYDASNALIKDSGKVVSSVARSYAPALAVGYVSVPGLRWTVKLWDFDGVASSQLTSNLFKLSTSPAVVLPSPSQNGTVNTGQPTIAWTPGIAAGATQKSYFLEIKRTSDNTVVFTASAVSTATSVTPPQIILQNTMAYVLTLTVTDTDGLFTTIVRNFTATYVSPPDVQYTVDFSSYQNNGYVSIDWTSFSPDSYFICWRVYRKKLADTTWTLLYEDHNSANRSYHDWLVTSVDVYQYIITQVADRSGVSLESYLNPNAPYGTVSSTDYWLIIPDGSIPNVRISVKSDVFTDDIETKEEVILGRGRRVSFGTRLGMSGLLTVFLRNNSSQTAREIRASLKVMQTAGVGLLMRDPFGNITKIALIAPIGFTRLAGVGSSEYGDITIPYKEVY